MVVSQLRYKGTIFATGTPHVTIGASLCASSIDRLASLYHSHGQYSHIEKLTYFTTFSRFSEKKHAYTCVIMAFDPGQLSFDVQV